MRRPAAKRCLIALSRRFPPSRKGVPLFIEGDYGRSILESDDLEEQGGRYVLKRANRRILGFRRTLQDSLITHGSTDWGRRKTWP